MKLEYLPGQFTNIVHSASGVTETEIYYILVSRLLSVEDFRVYPGVYIHGVLVVEVRGVRGTASSFQKRYKHRVTAPETMSSLACLVAVFWWWMSQVSPPPMIGFMHIGFLPIVSCFPNLCVTVLRV